VTRAIHAGTVTELLETILDVDILERERYIYRE
jgi:hypothetical protein